MSDSLFDMTFPAIGGHHGDMGRCRGGRRLDLGKRGEQRLCVALPLGAVENDLLRVERRLGCGRGGQETPGGGSGHS